MVEKAAEGCLTCRAPLGHLRLTTGRPRVYCGDPCRRAGEFAIRRLVNRLEKLETRASEFRLMLAGDHETHHSEERTKYLRGEWTRRLAAVEAELGRTEGRLRALLAANEPEPDRAA